MNIDGYILIAERNLRDFETKINRLIYEGWELHGNVQVVENHQKNTTYYQSMVLPKDNKPNKT